VLRETLFYIIGWQTAPQATDRQSQGVYGYMFVFIHIFSQQLHDKMNDVLNCLNSCRTGAGIFSSCM